MCGIPCNLKIFLSILFLSSNSYGLVCFQFAEGSLTELQNIALYCCHGIELFQMKQLRRLYLDCNQIKYIPDEFGLTMVNLEVLTISNNRVKWLPMSLKNLKKLESIHLSHNKFDLFPFVLCQMESLKFLDISSNYINDIGVS